VYLAAAARPEPSHAVIPTANRIRCPPHGNERNNPVAPREIGHGQPESTATINDPLQAARQSAAGVAAIASLLGDERAETLEQARRLAPLRAALIDALPGTGASGRTEWLAELWEHRAPLSQALRSMLGQLAAAASGTVTSWSDQTDEVMIAQGEASARVGQFISARVVPSCDGLAERLSGGGAILDVGTGIGALATALAEAFPAASVIGIDIADRPLQIARQRLNQREPALQQRVRYAEQDIIALRDINVYDLIWLPAPFLPSDKLNEALAVSASALREGAGSSWALTPSRWTPRQQPWTHGSRFSVQAAPNPPPAPDYGCPR
jgi:methylase of polypeptide subunit release factors